MNDLTHIDLFSGIGGFALAARANGIRTVAMCEKDERCRDFLGKAWPGVEIHEDVRTFDGTRYAWAFLLTAGVPCQPASRAGKQGGASDDRWLWPDALRVLSESRPAWAVFENPDGIADVGLDGILSDVERRGYEVQPVHIPACAVNAPHRRGRYWIICRRVDDATSERRQGSWVNGQNEIGTGSTWAQTNKSVNADSDKSHLAHPPPQQDDGGGNGNVAEAGGCGGSIDPSAGGIGQGGVEVAASRGSERRRTECDREVGQRPQRLPAGSTDYPSLGYGPWSRYVWTPCADGKIRRAPDDSFGLVDGLHRSVLGALGNSIVPQVAEEIIRAIVMAENENER